MFFLKKNKIKKKNLSIAFIGDVLMKRINKEYRKKDKITDVLSFRDSGDSFGEVLINYAQIKRQAKKHKQAAKSELIFILIHGLLHLKGYNDNTEREAKHMEALGNKFILQLKQEKII